MANTISVRFEKKNLDLDKIKEGVVRTGFFEGSRYEGGKTVASVAAANEFGVPKDSGERIPPRPFMRPAVHRNRQMLVERLRSEYKKALRNNTNTMDVLEIFGQLVQGLIQNQIINTTYPPNAPSTIKRKGINAPLRDTKLMLHSVSHQEEEIMK